MRSLILADESPVCDTDLRFELDTAQQNLKAASNRIEGLTGYVSELRNLLRNHKIPFRDPEPFSSTMNMPDCSPWKVEQVK